MLKKQAPKRDRTDYIVVHATATAPGAHVTAEKVDRWHRQRGWLGMGYHLLIRRGGRIEWGRHPDAVGAHVRHWNDRTLGIALAGGVDSDDEPANNFTDNQLRSLKQTIALLRKMYPNAAVAGHNDFPDVNKACPCFDARAWAVEKGFPAGYPLAEA